MREDPSRVGRLSAQHKTPSQPAANRERSSSMGGEGSRGHRRKWAKRAPVGTTDGCSSGYLLVRGRLRLNFVLAFLPDLQAKRTMAGGGTSERIMTAGSGSRKLSAGTLAAGEWE
jgi:hypothetical protein